MSCIGYGSGCFGVVDLVPNLDENEAGYPVRCRESSSELCSLTFP